MTLKIINKTRAKIEKKIFERTARIALKKSKRKIWADVVLIFAGDLEIKKLNKNYRRKNKVTDVLSFPNIGLKEEKFVMPERKDFYLGEIIISLPQAKRQAKEYGCSLKSELMRLFTHGLLHLLGYDHVKTKERVVMEKIESGIMNNLDLK